MTFLPTRRRPSGGGRASLLDVVAWLLAAAVLSACAPVPRGATGEGGPSGPVGATIAAHPSVTIAVAGAQPSAGVSASTPDTTPAVGDLTAPFACPEPTVTPLDGDALQRALDGAAPGTVISLERGTYVGTFTITRSGTAADPIYLCGDRDSVLDAKGQARGYTLHLLGVRHWRLDGFTVRSGQKGVMVDRSSFNVLQGLTVVDVGDEGVHLRKNSTDNVVKGLVVRNTGLLHPKFGEGLYVGSARSNWCELTGCQPDRSDRNVLLDNRITMTTAESVDIKEGTSAGVLSGNSFDGTGMVASAADSWVDVKGNGWTIQRNQGRGSPLDGFQTHVILPGWGDQNVFVQNESRLTAVKGVGIAVHKLLSNTVHCDNTTQGGRRAYNVPCVQ